MLDNKHIIHENIEERNETELLKKRMRLKALIVLLFVSFFALVTSAMAWFTLSSFAAVNTLEMSIGTGADLLIAEQNYGTDISRYTKNLTTEMIDSQISADGVKLETMKLDPLTSGAGLRFYTENNAEREKNIGGFLEFDIYLIATKEMWVHLSSADSENGKGDGTKVSTTNTGENANVVRAVRLSFQTENDGTRIYEPNKGAAVAGQTTFDLPNPMVHSQDTRLVHLNEREPQKVTIRVWVEGEDPECDNSIQNALLDIQLCFRGTDENNEAI